MSDRDNQWELFDFFPGSSAAESVRRIIDGASIDPELSARVVASLPNVTLDSERSVAVLDGIMAHHQRLAQLLSRSVDLRVAAMDYAVAHPELIEEPIVVDRQALAMSRRLAAVDGLTGLFNRRFLDVALTKELNRARRYEQVFSVLFIDLDDFKQVNDTYGHELGDVVLQTVGREIRDLLRQEDIAARYGGEEFLVILPQTPTSGALHFAERLLSRIRAVSVHPEVRLSFSGGISSFPQSGTTVDDLVRSADTALYQAKRNGKDQVRVFIVDKRRAPRRSADAHAFCFADDSDFGEVQVCDVSTSGLSVEAETLATPGQTIRLRVRDDEGGTVYEIAARVVWSRKAGKAYRFGGAWAATDEDILQSLIDRVAAG
ncbi:MAG: diguanylate cyclase [Spirochaetaceae bacterium]|nr:MAG: diguanylate cyclase [Spirochaetaceae bacterium]